MTELALGEIEDAQIISASLRDPDRFSEIYERYADALYRYAARRVGRELAEDVVAEAFLAAFNKRATYRTAFPTARPWLFAIVNNQIARHHRTEDARYRALLQAKHEHGEEELADRVAASVSAQAWRRPLLEALRAIARRDREVLLMIAWGGLTYEEVSASLMIPVGTVRSRLNRARSKVREFLSEYELVEDA